jgi:hypothetical protein
VGRRRGVSHESKGALAGRRALCFQYSVAASWPSHLEKTCSLINSPAFIARLVTSTAARQGASSRFVADNALQRGNVDVSTHARGCSPLDAARKPDESGVPLLGGDQGGLAMFSECERPCFRDFASACAVNSCGNQAIQNGEGRAPSSPFLVGLRLPVGSAAMAHVGGGGQSLLRQSHTPLASEREDTP